MKEKYMAQIQIAWFLKETAIHYQNQNQIPNKIRKETNSAKIWCENLVRIGISDQDDF